MNRKPSILVVGSINADIVVRVNHFPGPCETLTGTALSTVPGGKGANQAVAASRLGADVCLVGRVGDDLWGRMLVGTIRDNGVNTKAIITDSTTTTGIAVIVVDTAGESRIIVVPGANQALCPKDIDTDSVLEHEWQAVVLQLEMPLETVCEAIRRGAEAGVPVIVDAGPAQSIPLEQLRGATIVSPNELEAYALTGIRIQNREDVCAAARKIRDATGAPHVVMKLGQHGASCHDTKGDHFFKAFPVTAVDTTAAGDTFTAALAVRMCLGIELHQAISYANAAGALAVTRHGAQPSLPTAAEVDAFLQEQQSVCSTK